MTSPFQPVGGGSVASFVRDLPSPVRDCLLPASSRFRGRFLLQACRFWRAHGDHVLAELEPERSRLDQGARDVGRLFLDAWPNVGPAFVKGVTHDLAEGRSVIEAHRNGEPVRVTTENEWPTTRAAELLVDEGAEALMVEGSPLHADCLTWIEERGHAVLEPFLKDPLRAPAVCALGRIGHSIPDGPLTGLTDRTVGLLDQSTAPWFLNRRPSDGSPYFTQRDPAPSAGTSAAPSKLIDRTIPSAWVMATLVFQQAWRDTLVNALPVKELREFCDEQAESPWTAAVLLDSLLGKRWRVAAAEALDDARRQARRWHCAIEDPFVVWWADGQLDEALHIGPGGATLTSGLTAALSRMQEDAERLASVDATPLAAIVQYCIESLCRAAPVGHSMASTEAAAAASCPKTLADFPDHLVRTRDLQDFLGGPAKHISRSDLTRHLPSPVWKKRRAPQYYRCADLVKSLELACEQTYTNRPVTPDMSGRLKPPSWQPPWAAEEVVRPLN